MCSEHYMETSRHCTVVTSYSSLYRSCRRGPRSNRFAVEWLEEERGKSKAEQSLRE
jgi:hypothetical protein